MTEREMEQAAIKAMKEFSGETISADLFKRIERRIRDVVKRPVRCDETNNKPEDLKLGWVCAEILLPKSTIRITSY